MVLGSQTAKLKLSGHIEAFAKELHCHLCKNIYKSPYTATQCGHIYCYECIRSYLKAGNMECPQCGVQIPGKSLTRNSSYSTMVQCITKIRNLLNGQKEDVLKEQADVLVSILGGVINDENEQADQKEPNNKNKRKPEDELKPNEKPTEKSAKKVKETSKPLEKIKETSKPVDKVKVKPVEKPTIIKESSSKPSKVKRFGLLLTGLSEDQKATIQFNLQNLSKLSGGIPFKIIKDYSPDTVTHIICACAPKSHCPRTLKYLLGIVGKSWIVSFDWVLESIEAGQILKEDRFVVTGDEAVKCDTFACEKSRADPGKLFEGRQFYLHGTFTSGGPSKNDLTNLIQLAGGIISKKQETGSITISDSQEFKKGEYPYTWLFDSISCYELKL